MIQDTTPARSFFWLDQYPAYSSKEKQMQWEQICIVHFRPREIPRVSGCKTHGLGKSLGFPSTLEISLGLRPREISWVSGNWAAGMDFPIPPLSWWSTDTILKADVNIFNFRGLQRPVRRVKLWMKWSTWRCRVLYLGCCINRLMKILKSHYGF